VLDDSLNVEALGDVHGEAPLDQVLGLSGNRVPVRAVKRKLAFANELEELRLVGVVKGLSAASERRAAAKRERRTG